MLDPKFSEEFFQWEKKQTSVRKIQRKEDDELAHGEEGGMVYKYDLPVVNSPIQFFNKLVLADEKTSAPTQVEKLFEILDCDKDTAYESFMIKMSQEYNNEVDMYGNITKAGEIDLRVLDFGVPIPYEYVSDKSHMKTVRTMARFNPDIPGAIELVHPNKFLPNLRPIEDFRHTPIVPISEKDIMENRKKIEERNRKGYYVEIKKDTIYFYTIAFISLSIIFYTFLMVNEKTMRIKTDLFRSKTLKQKAARGRDGLGKVSENEQHNLSKK